MGVAARPRAFPPVGYPGPRPGLRLGIVPAQESRGGTSRHGAFTKLGGALVAELLIRIILSGGVDSYIGASWLCRCPGRAHELSAHAVVLAGISFRWLLVA